MKITIDLDNEAATALATIIRRLAPDDYADALTERGVDLKAWYRALDALSLQLPIETPAPPAGYPGESGSRADIGRRQFLRDELAYRERLHPEPDEAELAYRARLTAELERVWSIQRRSRQFKGEAKDDEAKRRGSARRAPRRARRRAPRPRDEKHSGSGVGSG